MIFAGVCRELAGKVRRSPVLLLRGSMGYGDLAKRFKSAAPVVYNGSEAFKTLCRMLYSWGACLPLPLHRPPRVRRTPPMGGVVFAIRKFFLAFGLQSRLLGRSWALFGGFNTALGRSWLGFLLNIAPKELRRAILSDLGSILS